VPLLNVAANMRAGDPRAIDLSSRILLRLQGRVALDNAQVKADVERLAQGPSAPAVAFTRRRRPGPRRRRRPLRPGQPGFRREGLNCCIVRARVSVSLYPVSVTSPFAVPLKLLELSNSSTSA